MLTPETGFNLIPPQVAWQIVQALWQHLVIHAVLLTILPSWSLWNILHSKEVT
jgi:hypothetical protein